MMSDFIQPTNPFRKRIPTLSQRSNIPGYVVRSPEPAFVASRKRYDQIHDQDLMVVYHNALKALYQMTDSSRLYLLHDEMKVPRTLLGQQIQYLNGQSVHELVPENQKTFLGDYWRGTPANEQVQRGKSALGIYSKQYLWV